MRIESSRMKRETRHIPVLLDEVLDALQPAPGKTIVDCTLGLGGHSAELLRRITPGGRLTHVDGIIDRNVP